MKLKIHNIGCISEAEVQLNGLTIVAGSNGSGKSTISKIIFSTIKAMANLTNDKENSRQALLDKYCRSLYSRLSSAIRMVDNPSMPRFSNEFAKVLWKMRDSETLKTYLKDVSDYIDGIDSIPPRSKQLAFDDISSITALLSPKGNLAQQLGSEIRYFVESEFMNQITTNGQEESHVEFQWGENKNDLVEFNVKNDELHMVKCNLSHGLEDATYVETPLYLPLIDAIRMSSTYVESPQRGISQPMVPLHVKDITNKYSLLRAFTEKNESPILHHIEQVIDGYFVYSEDKHDILFVQRGDKEYVPMNVASGIKTMGLLQILLQSYSIGPNKPLLWDEPENHLHPEWQIKFAEMLVLLAKQGIPVVVSTHSPYFVQSIRYFSAKYSLEKFTDYYLTELNDGIFKVLHVNDDLNQIFTKLAEPLREIMNVPNPAK